MYCCICLHTVGRHVVADTTVDGHTLCQWHSDPEHFYTWNNTQRFAYWPTVEAIQQGQIANPPDE